MLPIPRPDRTTILTPLALLVPLLVLRDIRRRRELTLRADPLSIQVEEHGHRRQDHSYAADERGGPLDSHTVEHLRCEEREDTAEDGAHEGVGGDGGGSEHQVRVDDVVEETEEDTEDTEASKEAGQNGDDPVDVAGIAAACLR